MAGIRRRRAAGQRALAKLKGKPRLSSIDRARTVKVSAAVQARYKKRLQAANVQYKKQVDKRVKVLLKQIEGLDRSKPGAFGKQVQQIEKRIGGLSRSLAAADKKAIAAVDKFIAEMDAENKTRTVAVFKKKVGEEAAAFAIGEKSDVTDGKLRRLRDVYVQSITSANREYSDRVQRALYDKLANPGVNARKKITRAKGIVSRRIKNTVQSQAHEVNATLNQTRQRALGAGKYMWQTKEDERVRHTHSDNNRIVFSWSKRPDLTGHPGEDYNCRCDAIPIFDNIPVGTRLSR